MAGQGRGVDASVGGGPVEGYLFNWLRIAEAQSAAGVAIAAAVADHEQRAIQAADADPHLERGRGGSGGASLAVDDDVDLGAVQNTVHVVKQDRLVFGHLRSFNEWSLFVRHETALASNPG